ncbi:MAG TPA: class I SAM-dependent methyltransferase [Burkholderiaceae bacterium]|nr:class I SAM-dependent methyltransferase [Burkholderiaceae bacterium]
MKNAATWAPTKFERHRGHWRGARDARELGIGSRLMGDLVAAVYEAQLPARARGRLLDLGCGSAPLYGLYAPLVDEVVTVDWQGGAHVDLEADLARPLPFPDSRFDTIVLSDVLEHVSEPALLWREMARVLAPGGEILMNVPFYYSIHAHPHDYYRYTNFALERFAVMNGLQVLRLDALGGIVEIAADLFAKALSKAPLVGPPLAMGLQWAVGAFGRSAFGARIARVSSRHFPFGYFMVAQRPK